MLYSDSQPMHHDPIEGGSTLFPGLRIEYLAIKHLHYDLYQQQNYDF